MQTNRSQVWLRVYVGGVITAGSLLLGWAAPTVKDYPLQFVGLLAMASALSALKIHVPLARGWATMSTSFAALLVAMLTV
ncbi:MAG: hypothetical protein ACR2LU_12030, partial [Luteitalea sp.]